MPHIVVKMISGRTEAQKQALVEKLANSLISELGSDISSISVAIEDVPQARWESDVFIPEIKGKRDTLYKKPGYASVD
ncbi:tautomerase family protein [Rhizobium sp. LjRoot258]|uniref:tautomerase family protein n=1 Tax=Rhizobium sp. LjRoot258 TaxID=3342299 RepID=UPI003ECEE63D